MPAAAARSAMAFPTASAAVWLPPDFSLPDSVLSSDDAAARTVPGPTTTVTATASATATVTATVKVKVPVTVTPTPAAPVEPPPSTTDADEFDRGWARDIASDIEEDLSSVDERLGDGIGVSSALYLLSDSYRRLLDAGIPPGADPAKYTARLKTLSSFAQLASDEYDTDATQASARYAVIRRETGVLFAVLNSAMGTSFRLP